MKGIELSLSSFPPPTPRTEVEAVRYLTALSPYNLHFYLMYSERIFPATWVQASIQCLVLSAKL